MKKKRSQAGPVFAALVLILIAAAVFLIQRYTPTKEKADLYDYFGITDPDEAAVILQDHLVEEKGLMQGEDLYIDYQLVRDELNSRFYWDEPNRQIIFTTPLLTFEIPVNSAEYTIDGTSETYERIILLENEKGRFLSMDFLALYTDLQYTLVREEEGPLHVLIRNEWGMFPAATVRKNGNVRRLGGIKSPILTTVEKDDLVYVLEEYDDWVKVLTQNGFIGFIETKRLGDIELQEFSSDFVGPEYTGISREGRVNLVWHQIDVPEANAYLEDDIAQMSGVTVISPTWFSLADNEGRIDSFASETYVEQAHAAGLEIWALINNFSPYVDTTTVLASTSARRRMVNTLVSEALRLGIEGINLDLEYIGEEDAYSYVQFVREMSIACRKNHLVLSVDIPVPMEFNRYFNRKELGIVCDYVIMMGYDEHYVGSAAGSVASYDFERNGIIGTLEDVPAKKLISGVPFYTRIWYTALDENGQEVVNSEEISMDVASNTAANYGVTPVWKDETGQYYVSWQTEDGVLCQIWMEEEESLAMKAALVSEYDLGGIAAWVLGQERADIWDIISNNIA